MDEFDSGIDPRSHSSTITYQPSFASYFYDQKQPYLMNPLTVSLIQQQSYFQQQNNLSSFRQYLPAQNNRTLLLRMDFNQQQPLIVTEKIQED